MTTRKTATTEVVAKSEQTEQVKTKFSKEQILASARYANRRDLVDALLDEDKSYTMEETEDLIQSYKKGQVK